MNNTLEYMVCCRLTLAQLECGQVVGTSQHKQQVRSTTAELSELFADLYEQFRSPQLLGLQITSISPRLAPEFAGHAELLQ
ncbi:hypothetical protein [Hymenobacter swuensis]|uniref:Uncharacterized protein n=1 Tax=Hymenobacter swuensis DY53 TaxID=1227739 RepID=W8F1I7_9BACT|nr:hypothetical protein [Hymenobacter swuensis]AHJ95690.1 hypothetical protein Hsw_0095 [Hymenobacter swuensis DY53]